MSKNLILGIAEDLTFKDLELFIGSLKKVNYEGDICLFVSGMNAVNRNTLRQYGVKTVAFNNRFPYTKDTSEMEVSYISTRYTKSDFKKIPMRTFRFIMYYLYLSKHKDEYSRVLLADTRDVIFQKDPFDFGDDKALYCFLENKNMTIGSCPSNSAWIRDLCGEKTLSEIGENNIICSGVNIGGILPIMRHLENRIEVSQQFKKSSPKPIGGDQAAHNYIIYKIRPKNVKLVYNETGPVMNLHYVSKDAMRFNNDGLLINDNGDVVNIVHQYDRHPFLIEKLQGKYSIPELPAGIHLRISAGIYDFLRSLKRKLYRLMRVVLFDFTHPLRHRIRLCACYLRK